jgi:hypothetical protein
MCRKMRTGLACAVVICFLLGCSAGAPRLSRKETAVELIVKTVPCKARLYINSSPAGQAPARVRIPCVVYYQTKGDPAYTPGSVFAGTLENSLAILGYAVSTPICLVTWPYGFFVGAVTGDRDTMLAPLTAARRVPEHARALKRLYARTDSTRILNVVPRDSATVELSAEWEDTVVRRPVDLRWFVKDPYALPPAPPPELTLVPDTDD